MTYDWLDPRSIRQQPQMLQRLPQAEPAPNVGQTLMAQGVNSLAMQRYLRDKAASQMPTVQQPWSPVGAPLSDGVAQTPAPDPTTGEVSPQGSPRAVLQPSRGGGNNPGNIIDVTGKTTFLNFASPAEGIKASIDLARSYPGKYNSGQPMSLEEIGARWAPDDDGKTPLLKGNNSKQWAANVAAAAGLDPRAKLDLSDPRVAALVAKGIHIAEHGRSAAYNDDMYYQAAGVQQ